jgi:hypothetical protein
MLSSHSLLSLHTVLTHSPWASVGHARPVRIPRVRFLSSFFLYLNLHNPPGVSGGVDISFLSKEECQNTECAGHMVPLAATIGSEVSTWPGWSSEILLWCLTETMRNSLSSYLGFAGLLGWSHLDSSPSKKDSGWTLATHWTGTVKDDDH